MALAVPLSRFTSRVGGGSAFFVRPPTFMEKFDDDYMELIKMLKTYHERIEKLEADLIQQKARTQAVFLCVRDFAKPDPKHLLSAFEFYSKEIHQKMLERAEDIDPWWATRMDKRDGNAAP